MKRILTIISFLCASPASYSMQNNVLINSIIKRVCLIERNASSNGVLEYKATLIDEDIISCKKHSTGTLEAVYFLYLNNEADRKKAQGCYENIQLEGFCNQPHAVLKAMQKKFKEQNTINKHCCSLT